jgi:predicted transcriptional regulator
MTSITIYLDNATEERLRLIADETGRRVEELAASAVSQEALRYFRSRHDDPGSKPVRASLAARRLAMEITP